MDPTATAAMKTTHLASPTPRPAACGPCPPIVTCHTTTSGGTQGGTTCASAGPTGTTIGGGGGGDDDDEPRILLICLRGIVAFVWAASRSALQKMLIAYLQSTVSPTWHSFIATATTTTATAVRAGAPWLHVVDTQPPLQAHHASQGTLAGTAVVAHRAVSLSRARKASWSYLRGTHDTLTHPYFKSSDEGGGGVVSCPRVTCRI